uniref:Methylthioribose-1-phosphate isomerase n=1 Tax=Candidatus Kentrum eta TaxID=2126337 RepID=A0A450VDF2_9GAMM|nr:MAG: methylthioribose-1-phosphate isomerase [Candidatus Kentron sp. H]VFK03572.1 MAG: methylthioribose-1-phosphate isomerase [Candidatus Kentron sp. H]VFK05721.1 MAG: methylthioribose-1-phosphate isomerase [Candidatus Kentron sp. H]
MALTYNPENDATRTICWTDAGLHLRDQRVLPARVETVVCATSTEVATAIRDMVVRGAPAIGITAAYGVVLAARGRYRADPARWKTDIWKNLAELGDARPTAVNLAWALERMSLLLRSIEEDGDPEPVLLAEAERIHEEDIRANREMGRLGAELIEARCSVLTHCNAGALATGGYGTSLGVIRSAFLAGKIEMVYADETRPWLQGTRLTAWELAQDGIPVRLIADNAAALAMSPAVTGPIRHKIRWAIVGSDRIAANGDVANKIGTYSVAINARYHGVRFMVVAPTSTIDRDIPDGSAIPIEVRPEREVLSFAGAPIAPEGVGAWNPVFDVTPAALVDFLVTERGVIEKPNREKIVALMA